MFIFKKVIVLIIETVELKNIVAAFKRLINLQTIKISDFMFVFLSCIIKMCKNLRSWKSLNKIYFIDGLFILAFEMQ